MPALVLRAAAVSNPVGHASQVPAVLVSVPFVATRYPEAHFRHELTIVPVLVLSALSVVKPVGHFVHVPAPLGVVPFAETLHPAGHGDLTCVESLPDVVTVGNAAQPVFDVITVPSDEESAAVDVSWAWQAVHVPLVYLSPPSAAT